MNSFYLSCDVESKMSCIEAIDQYVVCMSIHVDFELKKMWALGEGLDGPYPICVENDNLWQTLGHQVDDVRSI